MCWPSKKDLKLYMDNVVDVEMLCNNWFREKSEIVLDVSLKSAEKKILKRVLIDKAYQNFPWMLRPLLHDAFEYATLDGQLTSQLWFAFKSDVGIDNMNFNVNNLEVSCLYR